MISEAERESHIKIFVNEDDDEDVEALVKMKMIMNHDDGGLKFTWQHDVMKKKERKEKQRAGDRWCTGIEDKG